MNYFMINLQYFIKNNNKMKDQVFLNNLVDFTDLKTLARNQLIYSQNKQSRQSLQSKSSHLNSQCELDLDNNEKLIKSFKQIRQQLKETKKNCQKLRAKLNQKQTQVSRLKCCQQDYITMNHQLKLETEHLKHSNQDYKAKLQILKEMIKGANKSQEQIQFLKITVNDLKNKNNALQLQKNKILQISIMEKVQLQQKIKKFEAKKSSDVQYVQDMEIQVSKLRQKYIKLQNQMKKIQIKYDQQIYTKKWGNGTFQIEHLQNQLKQADAQNQQLISKNKKQKQKRNILEKKVLELEQNTGLCIVKCETYEIQNRALQKKYKKLQKKMDQIKSDEDRKLSEILTLEQKFHKANVIFDELISRVKKQLYGDIVAMAKSCQFRLNKLKQQKEGFFKSNENEQGSMKSISQCKARSRSKSNIKIKKNENIKDFQTQAKPTFINLKQKFDQCILKSGIETFNQRPTQRSKDNNSQTSTRSLNPLAQIDNIQARIKKQRDEMQRKIRQKMLYRKLQVANSPQKHQLRQDYFRLFDN